MENWYELGSALYQWDTGREVELTLPEGETASVMEFTVNSEANALVVEITDGRVQIPNILLQRSGSLKMWAVAITADGRQTRRYASCAIIPRAKPDDYIYTETEVLDWRRLEGEIDALAKSKADADYMTALFKELKALILAGDTDGAVALLDQAILDNATLA